MQTEERPTTRPLTPSTPAPPGEGRGASFLFGVGTSDHQSEAYDPRFPDIWDLWEARMDMTRRGRATDFWNRYREDIALARELGACAFRFSIAWARVEPRPGEWNEEAFEHYRDVLRCIREAGMEPVVTLMHWVWPVHVEERGGMAAAEFPQWFGRYAAEVARRLGADVRYWITANEPNALPFGYIRFAWQEDYPMPPGLGEATSAQQVEAVRKAICNLFLAHTAARHELRAVNPQARVSANPCVLGFPDWVQAWLDRHAIRSGTEEQWLRREADYLGASGGAVGSPLRRMGDWVRKFRSLGTLCNTNWWYLGMAGKLPPYLCPPECVGQQDYVAMDYYWGISALRLDRVISLLGAMQQQFERAPVWSKGLYRALRYLQRLFPGQDILIAENGCPEREDGLDRLNYIQRHVGEVLRACRHGVPVIGYLCWSITTCREWGLRNTPACDFGLYHVDLENDPELTRQPTPTGEGFRQLIQSITDARR